MLSLLHSPLSLTVGGGLPTRSASRSTLRMAIDSSSEQGLAYTTLTNAAGDTAKIATCAAILRGAARNSAPLRRRSRATPDAAPASSQLWRVRHVVRQGRQGRARGAARREARRLEADLRRHPVLLPAVRAGRDPAARLRAQRRLGDRVEGRRRRAEHRVRAHAVGLQVCGAARTLSAPSSAAAALCPPRIPPTRRALSLSPPPAPARAARGCGTSRSSRRTRSR